MQKTPPGMLRKTHQNAAKVRSELLSNTSHLHVVVYQAQGMVDGARARTQNMIECNS